MRQIMKTNVRHILSAAAVLLVLLSACSREEKWSDMPHSDRFLQIEGEIAGAEVADTRVNHLDPLTLSYASFDVGDDIGFFSYHEANCNKGNHNTEEKNSCKGYLKNEKLTYTNVLGSHRFMSSTVADITLSTLGVTFAYFPYTDYSLIEDAQTDPSKGPKEYKKYADGGYKPLEANDYYLDIFREEDKFEDLLAASKRQYFNINYRFEHQFSMLLLYLGEGFDPKDNDKLTVHLTEKVIGAHVTRRYFNWERFEVTVDKVPKSEASNYSYGSSRFTTEKIEKYRLPNTSVDKTVYPIILPPGVEIDYIEVKDISGMLQKVKPTEETFTDSKGNPTGLVAGKMYPLTIKMTGITPTIYPHDIIDWVAQEPIEVNELPGIYDAIQFGEWLSLYNGCVDRISNNTLTPDEITKLQSYGEWNEDEKTWTFYLRDNIDCSTIVPDGSGVLIKKLPKGVILDGRNNILNGLMLNFEDKTKQPTDGKIGMIGEINGGTLEYVRVEFVTVRNMHPDIPSGCIAAEIKSGSVKGCTVRNAAMISRDNKQSGVLAGVITGGMVHECKIHGTIQADLKEYDEAYKTYEGVAGDITGDAGDLDLFPVINRLIFTEEKPSDNK